MTEQYSTVYMYHIFIYSSVNGHLGYLHLLVIVNSAARSTGAHVSFLTVFFSQYKPKSRTDRSYGSSIFSC